MGGDVSNLYTTSTDQEFGDLIDEHGGQTTPLFDAQANTNAVLDSSGTVQAQYKYQAYGNVSSYSISGEAWDTLTVPQWATMTVDQWAELPVDLMPQAMTGMGGQRQYYLDIETQLVPVGGRDQRKILRSQRHAAAERRPDPPGGWDQPAAVCGE